MNEIKKKRLELEMTQYDVERLTGISQSKLSLIETGYREPNFEENKKLAKILRTKIKELFKE